MKQRILKGVAVLILLLALIARASYVLMPPRTEYGAGWNMYRCEPAQSVDLLIFGSSMAYCDLIPAELYARTGLSAYLMAGPEQTFGITYDYIKEALRTQTPSLIALELSGVMFQRHMGYTKANIGYMPYWSPNRLEATLRAAEREEWMGLFFPLYNYHERFGDPRVLLRPREDECLDVQAGFTLMTEVIPQESRGERSYELSEESFSANLEDLDRILSLCEERNIPLLLFQAPSCAYLPAEALERLRGFVGDRARVKDFNEDFEAMALDPARDFCDFLHTNVYGAEKFTARFAAYLAEDWGQLSPCPHDEGLWQWRVDQFRARRKTLDA